MIHTGKFALRDLIRKKIDRLDPSKRTRLSHLLIRRLVVHPSWMSAANIGIFAGRHDEVDTSILWQKNFAREKRFLYPKVHGGFIKFHHARSLDDLESGRWGIAEPTRERPDIPDLVLVPGVAFNLHGNRLGRGKGYYDRYLAAHPGVKTLGIAFDFQVVPEVPLEPHDCPVSGVVTEHRTLP